MSTMSKTEREELAKLLRQRTNVAKRMAEQRAGELLADVEAQLAAVYKADDPAWRELTAAAEAKVREADAALAARCRELGIPEELRPSLQCGWWGRGESGARERRAELRKVAERKVEAAKRRAFAEVEKAELEGRMLLARDGLESAEALAFLGSMPSPEALMPKVDALRLVGHGPPVAE